MAVCHTQHHLSLVQVKRCHESDSVFLNNMVSLSLSAQSRGLWVVFFPWKISPDLYLWNENVYIRKGRKSSKRSWAVIHVAGGVVWCVPAVGDEPHDAAPSRCSENQMCDARARTGCYQRRFTETSQENCGDVPETNSPHVQNKHTQEPGRYQCYGQLLHCNIEEQLVMLVTNAGVWTPAQGNVFSVPSHNTPNFQSLLNNGFRENCSSHYRASEPGWKGK